VPFTYNTCTINDNTPSEKGADDGSSIGQRSDGSSLGSYLRSITHTVGPLGAQKGFWQMTRIYLLLDTLIVGAIFIVRRQY
jgi:hypothetical protein